jgi:hypothetical protein
MFLYRSQLGYVYFMDSSYETLNRMLVDGTGFSLLDWYYSPSAQGIAIDTIGRSVFLVVYGPPFILNIAL